MESSPLPAKKLGMPFSDALLEVVRGKRVTRESWKDNDAYLFLRGGLLKYHKTGEPENSDYDLLVSEADILGMDWQIVENRVVN